GTGPSGMNDVLFIVLMSLVKGLGLLFIVILPLVSYTVYAERKVSAYIQDRVGPNRVGLPLTLFGFKKDLPLFGLVQPFADVFKLLLKEVHTPAQMDKVYYWLAPALVVAR